MKNLRNNLIKMRNILITLRKILITAIRYVNGGLSFYGSRNIFADVERERKQPDFEKIEIRNAKGELLLEIYA